MIQKKNKHIKLAGNESKLRALSASCPTKDRAQMVRDVLKTWDSWSLRRNAEN
jgi:hypothetical protein